jgi:hypothetical protein
VTARWRVGACLATLAALSMSCQLDELLHEGATPPSHRPAQLVFTTVPLMARAGHPISPPVQVTLQDSAGQPTAGDSAITVRLGANPGQAKLAGDTAARTVNGVARFVNLRLKRAATGYTLTARYPGLPPDTSRPFTVAPDSPTGLTFTVQPSAATAGRAIAPPVEITAFDSLGNQATTFGGVVRVALGKDGSAGRNAKLAGNAVASAAAGVAAFPNLQVDRAGTGYTLTAAFGTVAEGRPPAKESAPFDITEPPPRATHLEVITQPPPSVLPSAPFQVQLAAVDSQSRIVSAFAGVVTIAIAHDGSAATNARLGGGTAAPIVNGIATFTDLSIDQTGVGYTLRASTPDLTGVTSQAFDVVL